MHTKNVLSAISGLLFIVAFFPYIKAIWQSRHSTEGTKPMKATWLIWTIMDSVLLAGMYAKSALNGQIVGAILGAWIITLLALKYGVPGWSCADKLCLGGTAFGIFLWAVSRNPILGIVVVCAVGFLGAIRTFQSAWDDPAKEDKFAWTFWWLSCVVAIFAIPNWTIADAAQPITFTTIESIMMYLLYIRPRLVRS